MINTTKLIPLESNIPIEENTIGDKQNQESEVPSVAFTLPGGIINQQPLSLPKPITTTVTKAPITTSIAPTPPFIPPLLLNKITAPPSLSAVPTFPIAANQPSIERSAVPLNEDSKKEGEVNTKHPSAFDETSLTSIERRLDEWADLPPTSRQNENKSSRCCVIL